MGWKPKQNQNQDQDQDQDQKQAQANLQAQLQGQLQGQGQGQGQAQGQIAVQSLESNSDNDNKNGNWNGNWNDNKSSNENKNENENKVDNKLKNDVDNKVDNKIENVVDNKVNVDIKVDLDLKATGLSSPVIDLHDLHNVAGSVVIPEAVYQTINGGGNAFDINQINNLINDNKVDHPSVSFSSGGDDFKMDAKAHGGDMQVDSHMGNVTAGTTANGLAAHADTVLTQNAFDQTITQGANIQFNSLTMNVAGHDFHDSHNLGS
ncbi:hypothetical protein ACFFWD_29440 [Bradyrhizobium erythrophlei]|uniref:hypothetical protein n=1 Tax=Bradyrhizobium erythrophlei TaxID=1437360 RepID=UPI0035EE3622